MTDLELDVWDAWLRERQEHLEETLSNISPSEEPCLQILPANRIYSGNARSSYHAYDC